MLLKNNRISIIVIFLSFSFIGFVLLMPEYVDVFLKRTLQYMSGNFGWLFVLLVNILLLLSAYLIVGKYKYIKIGGSDAKPEFNTFSWISMLFGAGMGIGLMFYSVAEPVSHYVSNPMTSQGDDIYAAKTAMGYTFLHWGLHPWAIYAFVGICLAIFKFNYNLPLSFRSLAYPILKDRIYGLWGDIIDAVASLGILFGLATSLSIGSKQIFSGLSYAFDMSSYSAVNIEIYIILFCTFFAMASLLLGLGKGIARLSNLNTILVIVMLLFVIIVGPTNFLFKSFIQNLGFYLQNLIQLSFWTESYMGEKDGTNWIESWTVFYWAWWISWSPFVGVFLARISRGRTVGEFILFTILIPSLISFFWISNLGGSAIYEIFNGNSNIINAVKENMSTSIYVLFSEYPLFDALKYLIIFLVFVFFVTSSDSGSYVVYTLTSRGKYKVSVWKKVFWCSLEGAIAIIFLLSDTANIVQSAVIITALPLAILLYMSIVGFIKKMKEIKDNS